MKKTLVVICVLIASCSFAQDIKLGAKGGLNIADFVGDDTGGNDAVTKLYFGGYINSPITERLSFQPELLISFQGTEIKDDYSGESAKINTSYLNIPLLVKMDLGSNDFVSLYAGPQLGILLDAEVEIDGDSDDIEDEMNSIQLGINLGISLNVTEEVAIDFRYNRGLSKAFDGEGKLFSSVIQIGASFSF
ncbi:porin family protein [Ancylomarina sp. YFZ004]